MFEVGDFIQGVEPITIKSALIFDTKIIDKRIYQCFMIFDSKYVFDEFSIRCLKLNDSSFIKIDFNKNYFYFFEFIKKYKCDISFPYGETNYYNRELFKSLCMFLDNNDIKKVKKMIINNSFEEFFFYIKEAYEKYVFIYE